MIGPTGLWRQLTRGLRGLFDRAGAERDVRDEVDHYLEQAAAEHRGRGLSVAEARRAARLEMGSPTGARDQVSGYGWENVVGGVLADLRYAARRLRATPGFTLIAVLTIGVGIGATVAIFSAIKPILLEPLPYPEASRLVTLREQNRTGPAIDGTFGAFRWVEERVRSFESIAVMATWRPTLTGQDRPERLEGQRVSAGFFPTLGIGPAIGAGFPAGEDRPGGARLAILSDGLWRRRFGADQSIVGRAIPLDGNDYTVVAIMPVGFENVLAPEAEVWTLLQYGMDEGRTWGHHLRTVARLADGASTAQARLELARVSPDLVRQAAAADGFFPGEFAVTSLRDTVTGGVREALLAVVGAVLLLLAIAAVNVTNLLLARGASRRGELAVRATLGAGRGRLLRQLLTESLLLATIGGLVGIGIAALGVRALVGLSPAGLPRIGSIGIDGGVLAFSLGLTTLVGIAVGLVPALAAAGRDPHEGLQWTSRRSVGGRSRIRRALVIAEVALALVLLVSSGLLFRSLSTLLAVPSGFRPDGVLTVQVQVAGRQAAAPGSTTRFFTEALEAVRRLPGVEMAGLTSQLPLSGDRDEFGTHFAATPDREAASYSSFRYAVTAGYLETMGIPLRRGRLLSAGDRDGAPRVAVISESLANRQFGANDPIGARLRIGPTNGPEFTVVGVVGDVRQASLGLAETDAVYTTTDQFWFEEGSMSLAIRTGADPASLVPAVRAAVWSIDPDQPIVRVATMPALVASSAAQRRFALILFQAFALAALVLAAAGIYGVMSASVAERTREIGVRAALGASRGTTLGMVVREGMGLAAIGVIVGLAGAVAATRGLTALLYGVSRLDPVTYGVVTALLGAVALAATGLPAWRASRVDPATTLRTE